MITEKQIRQIMPRCAYPGEWVRPLEQTCARFEINTPLRIAAFLSQLAVESAELNRVEENLTYSPQRISAVWPKRFPTTASARLYSRNPEKLANVVYANRLGNGNEASGDGYKYHGRGLIQVTGKENYEKVGLVLDLQLTKYPEWLLQPINAALSAGAFWQLKELNTLADKGDIVGLSKAVNGGEHGLEQRKAYYAKALEVLGVGGRNSENDKVDSHGAQTVAKNWLG